MNLGAPIGRNQPQSAAIGRKSVAISRTPTHSDALQRTRTLRISSSTLDVSRKGPQCRGHRYWYAWGVKMTGMHPRVSASTCDLRWSPRQRPSEAIRGNQRLS